MMHASYVLACSLLPMMLLLSCQQPEAQTAGAPSASEQPTRLADPDGVHNLHRFAPGVYSGSMPYGDDGFDALAGLGVKTVISVDGARPDVGRAEARGMRYIHVPIQYSGINARQRMTLAKALDSALEDGPVFVHCHHGKHRGPAAAALALVTTGRIDAARGTALLAAAGTSRSYPGLWACVGAAGRADRAAIEALAGPLQPHVKVEGFVAAMAGVDRTWDHLKLVRKHGWQAPPDHPDLVPAAEAGMLYDLLRDLPGGDYVREQPDDFAEMLTRSIAAAESLEASLVAADHAAAERHFATLAADCKSCHTAYRNE